MKSFKHIRQLDTRFWSLKVKKENFGGNNESVPLICVADKYRVMNKSITLILDSLHSLKTKDKIS